MLIFCDLVCFQVPEGLEGNKGNIYMASTSPRSVINAYCKQFQNDFLAFLKHRAEELVSGGRMLLTILGRRSEDPSSAECCCIWELLAMALNEMVSEVREYTAGSESTRDLSRT